MTQKLDSQTLAERLVARALRAGATEAEVFAQKGERVHVHVNRGRIENLTRAGSKGVGLRVLVGGRLAFMSSSDFTGSTLDDLVDETVALASQASPEPWNGLPGTTSARDIPGIYDPGLPAIPIEEKIDLARTLDHLVFEAEPEIRTTEGAIYSDGTVENLILNSKGLSHRWRESFVSMVVSPVAEKGELKQVGHFWSSARRFRDLKPPEYVAREACRRAHLLLGGEPVATQKVSVVMDCRAGTALFEGLAEAVNGEHVYRGRSFLADKLGGRIGAERVNVIDDGTVPGGMASSPVDGEGVPTSRKYVVEQGMLRTFLYDSYTARKAGAVSTGNGVRDSYAGRPMIGGLNFYLEAGDRTLDDLISEVETGFYVLRTMGGGPNVVTGDFSAGAAGVWIEKGRLTRPVAKVTIAATMLEMLEGIDGVANDLVLDSATATPSYRIRQMTVSGI
jgi:PmbA protein